MQGYTFGLITAGAATLLGFFFHESIKSLISKWTSNLTPKQVNFVFFGVLMGLAAIAYGGGAFIGGVVTPESITQQQPMSDNEMKVEMAKLGVNTLKEVRDQIGENKRRKDSIREANREHKWVYQIGAPIADKRDLFNKYRLLKDKRMGNFYIFREARKNYLIILDDGQEESLVRSNLETIRQDLYPIDPDVNVIDLLSYCSRKEYIQQVKNIDVRGETITLPCRECNK